MSGVCLDEYQTVDLLVVTNNGSYRYRFLHVMCAFSKAMVTELWYVEEFDVLALALDGKMKVRKFRLGCSKA